MVGGQDSLVRTEPEHRRIGRCSNNSETRESGEAFFLGDRDDHFALAVRVKLWTALLLKEAFSIASVFRRRLGAAIEIWAVAQFLLKNKGFWLKVWLKPIHLLP